MFVSRFNALLVGSLIMLTGGVASAFTGTDADTIFNSYNKAFYVANGGNAYYKQDTGSGTSPGWWTFAEEIEMAEDDYVRTESAGTKALVTALCNGFISSNGSDWTYDAYNDDITWAVIAFSRAYQITGNVTFRNDAKANFDAMYSRGWDTTFTGGGLWWSTAQGSKNACINGPAAVAACYLYNIYADKSYLAKAEACYAWERRVLFSTNSGAIDDNIATTNGISTWASTYNQGTFIGAGNFLYRITGLPFYYQDAILAAKFTENSISSAGIFPVYSSGDLGGFNGIFARWVARMAKDQNLWAAYSPWLSTNANAAWKYRNTNNLSWYNWTAATPAGTNVLDSWDCSDSVIIMQVAVTNAPDPLQISPLTEFAIAAQQSVLPAPVSETLVLTNLSAGALNWSLASTSAWLTVSATTGTLAAGEFSTNLLVSLNPAATTNLPAGRYYSSLGLTDLTSGVVQSLPCLLVVCGGNAPIPLTGFNTAVIAPNNATAAAPNATAFDIPNNYCFYQAGVNGSTRGLPPDGVFTSLWDGSTVFQFLPYGSTNALVLGYNYPSSATLNLTVPQAYNSLAILACSADAVGGAGSLVLNFTNGTQSPALSFNAQDWFASTTNVAVQGIGRLRLGSSFGASDGGASYPHLYQTTFNLALLRLNLPIASITFTKPANAGTLQSCGVFAISGAVMPAGANLVQQPTSVTNNQPDQGASFTAVASGVLPLAYQWYFSSTGNSGTYAPLAFQTNNSLALAPVLTGANAGDYVVVVTNNLGSVTSSVVTLTVYRAPVISQQPSPTNLFAFSGSTGQWSVGMNAALPISYSWMLNGSVLPTATNSVFRCANLQLTNSGNYAVIVSNAFGAVTSSIVSLTVVAAPTYPFAQALLANNPLGYWRLDEKSGAIAHDYVAGNNGFYSAKVLLGRPGYNLVDTHTAPEFGFLAASNSCVTNILMDFSTTNNATFSVEAWANGSTQTTDAGLVTKGYGGGGEQFNLDCGGVNHAFRFFVRDASGNAHLATSSVVPAGRWVHLVGVCDEANGNVYLYVNGTNAAQAAIAPNSGLLTSASSVSIGSRQSGAGTAYDNQFVGYLEEVAIYGHALSPAQVLAHFQTATNRPPAFLSSPFLAPNANAGQLYSSTLATNAADPNGDAITFAKVSGPGWLTVAAGGAVSGTPVSSDVGTHAFMVSATDPGGLSTTGVMNLVVIPAPSIVSSAVLQGNQLTLGWTGGIAPYQVQMTTNLINPVWENLGAPITGNSLVISPTNDPAFYRVNGQ